MLNALLWVAGAGLSILVLLVLVAVVLEIRDQFKRVIPSPAERKVWLQEALFVAEKALPYKLQNGPVTAACCKELALSINRYLKLHHLRMTVQAEDVRLLIEAQKAHEVIQLLVQEYR